MINRDNWKVINQYLQYRRDVDLLAVSSCRLESTWLFHLLKWSDSVDFVLAEKIRPSFPKYLISLQLSPVYTTHIMRCSYRFFRWFVNRRGSSSISPAWLDTLKIRGMTIEHADHEAVTYDEICAIASAPVKTIRDRRIRASAVFWWLSGIRVGAFVTLPVSAVDLDNLTIKQWPKLGVKTKFKKHATTFLLDIPDLIEVLKDWDFELRKAHSYFWFASVSPETGLINSTISSVGVHRNIRAAKDLRVWLGRVGLPYHSPHKFRHGHAVYALKQAKDIPALKAISQNLMHSNLSITDGVYGILSDMDVQAQIKALGKKI